MKLARLAEAAGLTVDTHADDTVTGFAIDNRKVAPGTVFGAFEGARFNGEDFIPAAIAALAATRLPLLGVVAVGVAAVVVFRAVM